MFHLHYSTRNCMNVHATCAARDVQLRAWGKTLVSERRGNFRKRCLIFWTEKFHLSKQKFVMRAFNFARSVSAPCAGEHLRTHTPCLCSPEGAQPNYKCTKKNSHPFVTWSPHWTRSPFKKNGCASTCQPWRRLLEI